MKKPMDGIDNKANAASTPVADQATGPLARLRRERPIHSAAATTALASAGTATGISTHPPFWCTRVSVVRVGPSGVVTAWP
jgi:hypothetical protein